LKNKDLFIVTIGFIILGLGIALLNLGESSTFFIFPFFFAGNLAPILVIPVLFIMMMFFWWVNKNYADHARLTQSHELRPVYLRTFSTCQFCGNPLPEKAVFCSYCGNTVERNSEDNESFQID